VHRGHGGVGCSEVEWPPELDALVPVGRGVPKFALIGFSEVRPFRVLESSGVGRPTGPGSFEAPAPDLCVDRRRGPCANPRRLPLQSRIEAHGLREKITHLRYAAVASPVLQSGQV
jgi:hypothetical protein